MRINLNYLCYYFNDYTLGLKLRIIYDQQISMIFEKNYFKNQYNNFILESIILQNSSEKYSVIVFEKYIFYFF